MSRIIKPSAPLKSGEDYIMPVTTVDQIRDNRGQFTNVAMVDTTGADVTTEATAVKFGSDVIVDGRLSATQGELNKGISNFNILDNPFFTINQRKVTTFSGSVYGVDRWIASTTSTCNIVSGGIQISGAGIFYQLLELDRVDITKEVTASVKVDGVLYSGSGYFVNNGTFTIIDAPTFKVDLIIDSTRQRFHIISNQTIVVNCAKLEYGHASTLANDSVPNYQLELLKCQRYFYRYNVRAYAPNIYGWTEGANLAYATVHFPTEMRVEPTFASSTQTALYVIGSGNLAWASSVSNNLSNIRQVTIKIITSTSPFGTYRSCTIGTTTANVYFDFVADL